MRLRSFFGWAEPARAAASVPASSRSSAGRSHVGRVRVINEDRFLELPDCGLWAVADGMGGHSSGDLAASMVIEELTSAAERPGPLDETAIVAALHRANRGIADRFGGADRVSGTTVVVARIQADAATICWVGDSRAYRIRGGRAACLTRDHSLIQELIDAGVLCEQQAERHPQRNVVTRAIGIGAALDVAVVKTRLEPGDIVLLCSDGVSRSLASDDFAVAVDDMDELADTVLRNALDRDGSDNATVVVVQQACLPVCDDLQRTIQ